MVNGDQASTPSARMLWCSDCGSLQKFWQRDGNWFCAKCGRMMT
jgi:hypothetical protein